MKNIAIVLLVLTVLGMGFLLLGENDSNNSDDTSNSISENETPTASNGKTINLSSDGLREVPKDVLDDKSATTLDVSDNGLTGALPSEIQKLSNLEVLDASNNNLTGIPAEIGQLSKLRVVDFSNNDITGLPLEIGNLTNLEMLDLRGNPNVSTYDISLIQPKIPNAQILTD